MVSRLTTHKKEYFSTPMETNGNMCAHERENLEDTTMYQQLVGCLIHLTVTRPNIPYVVSVINRYMQIQRSHIWKQLSEYRYMWKVKLTIVFCARKVKIASELAIVMLTMHEIMILDNQPLDIYLSRIFEQFLDVVRDNWLCLCQW